MKRKTIVIALFVLITLSVFSQDFQMKGTVLAKYNGNAANVTKVLRKDLERNHFAFP